MGTLTGLLKHLGPLLSGDEVAVVDRSFILAIHVGICQFFESDSSFVRPSTDWFAESMIVNVVKQEKSGIVRGVVTLQVPATVRKSSDRTRSEQPVQECRTEADFFVQENQVRRRCPEGESRTTGCIQVCLCRAVDQSVPSSSCPSR